MNDDIPRTDDDLGVSADELVRNLAAAAGWMRFMAILGYVMAGFMALAGMVFLLGGSLGSYERLLGILYLAIAAVYLLPLLPLDRSARAAGRLRLVPDVKVAAQSLAQQVVFWRRLGILTLVVFGLSVVGTVLVILVGLRAGTGFGIF